MKARKKPVIIDYYPIDGTRENKEGLMYWVNGLGDNYFEHFPISEEFTVKTLEGTSYDITPEDVIIRGIKGEYYPCKKDIFEQTYDIVE